MMRRPVNEGKIVSLVDKMAHEKVSVYGSHLGMYDPFKKIKLLLITGE